MESLAATQRGWKYANSGPMSQFSDAILDQSWRDRGHPLAAAFSLGIPCLRILSRSEGNRRFGLIPRWFLPINSCHEVFRAGVGSGGSGIVTEKQRLNLPEHQHSCG